MKRTIYSLLFIFVTWFCTSNSMEPASPQIGSKRSKCPCVESPSPKRRALFQEKTPVQLRTLIGPERSPLTEISVLHAQAATAPEQFVPFVHADLAGAAFRRAGRAERDATYTSVKRGTARRLAQAFALRTALAQRVDVATPPVEEDFSREDSFATYLSGLDTHIIQVIHDIERAFIPDAQSRLFKVAFCKQHVVHEHIYAERRADPGSFVLTNTTNRITCMQLPRGGFKTFFPAEQAAEQIAHDVFALLRTQNFFLCAEPSGTGTPKFRVLTKDCSAPHTPFECVVEGDPTKPHSVIKVITVFPILSVTDWHLDGDITLTTVVHGETRTTLTISGRRALKLAQQALASGKAKKVRYAQADKTVIDLAPCLGKDRGFWRDLPMGTISQGLYVVFPTEVLQDVPTGAAPTSPGRSCKPHAPEETPRTRAMRYSLAGASLADDADDLFSGSADLHLPRHPTPPPSFRDADHSPSSVARRATEMAPAPEPGPEVSPVKAGHGVSAAEEGWSLDDLCAAAEAQEPVPAVLELDEGLQDLASTLSAASQPAELSDSEESSDSEEISE